MGNTESAEKLSEQESHATAPFDTKKILLLHHSNAAQAKIVRNFRDALISKGKESIWVTDFVNIADRKEIHRGLMWLKELNNVVLICLTSESIGDQFERIVRAKAFADQNGRLHPKVFTVSFGESLISKWPPKGLQNGSTDFRDFYFGFADVTKTRPEDFKSSLRMNSLIAAMKGTD